MLTAIGIDVGGTAIKGGLVTKTGEVLRRETIPTESRRGPGQVVGRIAALVASQRQTPRGADVTAVGLGVPGIIRRREGVVVASPNLPGWENLPLARLVEAATGLKVLLENDANAAALGEFICGAGRGAGSMVMLTLGTGIGSGIILDGKLWRGADQCAAEIGHTIVSPDGRACGCGQRGCLEAYASATSTAERAKALIEAGQTSSLRAILERGDAITAEDVVRAAGTGDGLALRVWSETCRYLALACVSIQHTLNPDCIVLAGGMSDAGEELRRPVQQEIGRIHSKDFGVVPTVRIAALGNDAGFIGAALGAFGPDVGPAAGGG